MAKKTEKQKFIKKLKNKYRLVIMNDSTFEEIFNFKLSRLNVYSFAGIITIILLSIGTLLIAFTPLREFIPNYPDGKMRRKIIMNALMIDSLQNELNVRDQYFRNLKDIINGNETKKHELIKDTDIQVVENVDSLVKEDSIYFSQFSDEDYNLASFDNLPEKNDISKIYFFPPVQGIITNKFNAETKHYGVDIVAEPEAAVLSALSGIVVLATWSLETGNIIVIQHENNLISVYKHNSMLLKDEGSFVKAGEPIAIIGNSGEYSTGPHLHFELWHKGIPVNPEKYIKF